MSQSRQKIAADFGISFPLEKFTPPPCQPPRGYQVLERFHAFLRDQKGNRKDAKSAAYQTAIALEEIWKLGDARIPRQHWSSIQSNILAMHEQLNFLKRTEKAKQPKYIKTVRGYICLIPPILSAFTPQGFS